MSRRYAVRSLENPFVALIFLNRKLFLCIGSGRTYRYEHNNFKIETIHSSTRFIILSKLNSTLEAGVHTNTKRHASFSLSLFFLFFYIPDEFSKSSSLFSMRTRRSLWCSTCLRFLSSSTSLASLAATPAEEVFFFTWLWRRGRLGSCAQRNRKKESLITHKHTQRAGQENNKYCKGSTSTQRWVKRDDTREESRKKK